LRTQRPECDGSRPRVEVQSAGRGTPARSSDARSILSSHSEGAPAGADTAWPPTARPGTPSPRPRTDSPALAELRGRSRVAAARRATASDSNGPLPRVAALVRGARQPAGL